MIYVGIACLVLVLLFCCVLCVQARKADEAMLLAYKEMMEERAKKEGVREITPGDREGRSGAADKA